MQHKKNNVFPELKKIIYFCIKIFVQVKLEKIKKKRIRVGLALFHNILFQMLSIILTTQFYA